MTELKQLKKICIRIKQQLKGYRNWNGEDFKCVNQQQGIKKNGVM